MQFGEGIVKTMVVAAIAAGFVVIIAKDGGPLGSFLNQGAQTVVSFGKGIGSIAG